MNRSMFKENSKIVVVKILNYLRSQQTQNNVNESIPNLDGTLERLNNFFGTPETLADFEPKEEMLKHLDELTQYFEFQNLILKELLEELQQGLIYDGILIADLKLCKKRVINEEDNKDSYGSIRVNDDGIYFEEKTNNRKK